MIRLAHIIDDPAFGGVVRYIETINDALGPRIQHTRHVVDTNALTSPRYDCDVVVLHATMSWRKLPFLLALRASNVFRPLVIVEHSYTEAFEKLHVTSPRRFRTMLRLVYRCADRVAAVSFGQAAWMRQARLLSASRLAVIPSFTDVTALSVLPLPVRTSGPIRLGAFGRYCDIKGFDVLIDAMQQVPPELATLEIRGLGPDADALTAQAANLPHVTVGGPVYDIAAYLSVLDAVVVPSRRESFGQVALEARAAGRPVIASAVDGLVEQIEPGTGFLVPAGDATQLAEAIRALASDNAFAAMVGAARDSASDHMARSTAAWLDLLAGLGHARSTTPVVDLRPIQPASMR